MMRFATIAARVRPVRATATAPLSRRNILIVDGDEQTTMLLRHGLERDHQAHVEVVDNYDEALDVLGHAARPIDVVMMDTIGCHFAAGAILGVLRLHKARIHVTLHGARPPEDVPFPADLVGAAAYSHLAISGQAIAAAEAVVLGGFTVHHIVDRRIIPDTLDWQTAIAIYGAEPGQPFPITLQA